MCKNDTVSKGLFEASVRSNRAVGTQFFRLNLELAAVSASVFGDVRPGQFVQLDVSKLSLPDKEHIPEALSDVSRRRILLRRPFSLADVVVEDKGTVSVDILYCVLGPATLRMTTLGNADKVSIIGPLGNGFSVPDAKKAALLVAGGIGAAPLQYLAKFLKNNYTDIEITVFVGAETANQLPFEVCSERITSQPGLWLKEFADHGVKSAVSTNDGSAGFKGLVTDCLADRLEENSVSASEIIIYSCGPEAMLAGVAEIAAKHRIDCQVSMERMMACGIGLCQSCAVECKIKDCRETAYKLCCKDGPVFDSSEIVFSL